MSEVLYMSTQEAAVFLNVSHLYLVRMLDGGELPYDTVGTQRRIQFKDVMAYKDQRQQASQAALQELVDQAQELNMGY